MEGTLRAIEVTGTIDEHQRLHLDEPLPVSSSGRVRVIVLVSDEDPEDAEWLQSAARDPAFDFLADSGEDVYTLDDGRPFDDQG